MIRGVLALGSGGGRGGGEPVEPPSPNSSPSLPGMQKTMEFHYGKHHTAYLNNLNGQIAGKPLEQLGSVHEVRGQHCLCRSEHDGPSPAAGRWREWHQECGSAAAACWHCAAVGSCNRPVALPALPPAPQVMMQSWNNGSPTPEFNNAAQVRRACWRRHAQPLPRPSVLRARCWLTAPARAVASLLPARGLQPHCAPCSLPPPRWSTTPSSGSP